MFVAMRRRQRRKKQMRLNFLFNDFSITKLHQTNLRAHYHWVACVWLSHRWQNVHVEFNEEANNNIISSNNTEICCDTNCPVFAGKKKKKTSTMDKWPRFMFNHFIIVMGNSSVAFILFTKIICSFTYSLRLSTRRCIEVLCVLDDSMNEYTQYGYLGYQPKIHDEQKLTLPLRGYNSEYV